MTDKAKAEVEKRRQKQLAEEKHQAMRRMDVNEDVNRAENAACAIRTFSDLDRDSAGEEFIGYDEILSGESDNSLAESESCSEDAATLKVRLLSQLKLAGHTYTTQ